MMKWTSGRYNVHRLTLGKNTELATIEWSQGAFKVRLLSGLEDPKLRFQNLDEAKKHAESKVLALATSIIREYDAMMAKVVDASAGCAIVGIGEDDANDV